MEGLTVGTVVRNATGYLDRLVNQFGQLASAWDAPIHLICVEGDSTDGTYDRLKQHPPQVAEFTLLHVEHGGPFFDSKPYPQRWRQMALACNAVLVHANLTPQTFLYVESDLIWDVRTLKALVNDLKEVPAVAPMSFMLNNPVLFYDVWGHTKNGQKFGHHAPYHNHIDPHHLSIIDTAGSCFAVRKQLLPHISFSYEDCIRGIGRTIRSAGHDLWLDPQLAVYHV